MPMNDVALPLPLRRAILGPNAAGLSIASFHMLSVYERGMFSHSQQHKKPRRSCIALWLNQL